MQNLDRVTKNKLPTEYKYEYDYEERYMEFFIRKYKYFGVII